MKTYINRDWKFSEDNNNFKTVIIPHTVSVTPFHYFSENEYQMICGYQKALFAPMQWKGKCVFLTIEGAAHYAEVFINGNKYNIHIGNGFVRKNMRKLYEFCGYVKQKAG